MLLLYGASSRYSNEQRDICASSASQPSHAASVFFLYKPAHRAQNGLLSIWWLQFGFTLLGLVWNCYIIADKGLGVPYGYPPEFPPIATMSILEVLGILEAIVGTAANGLVFARVWNGELKNCAYHPCVSCPVAMLGRLTSCS